MFRRQVYGSDVVPAVVEEALEATRIQAKKVRRRVIGVDSSFSRNLELIIHLSLFQLLYDIGLDLTFLLRSLLYNADFPTSSLQPHPPSTPRGSASRAPRAAASGGAVDLSRTSQFPESSPLIRGTPDVGGGSQRRGAEPAAQAGGGEAGSRPISGGVPPPRPPRRERRTDGGAH